MTHPIKIIFLLLLAFLLFLGASHEVFAKGRRTSAKAPEKYAAVVIEAETGYILHASNKNAARHPASLTKMMTLYLVFQAIETGRITLETRLPVSSLASRQPATKIGLEPGQTIRVYDAIMSLVTMSANDAAVVLAEGVGGSVPAFVAKMNQQAKALGMQKTVFKNPSGLPDKNQITTARDMAVLAHALIHHYPGFYPYFGRESYTYNGREMHNHNKLLGVCDGLDGIKTGYTNASGFNLAASATRNGTRVIGIVLGGQTANSRNRQMRVLIEEAFKKVRQPAISRALARGEKKGGETSYVSLPAKAGGGTPLERPRAQQKLALTAPQVLPNLGSAPDNKAWGLQIGAFSDVQSARRMLDETIHLSGALLEGTEQSLQKVTMTDGSMVYRARFLGLDQKTARAICSRLVRNGQNCLVVAAM